MSQGALLDLVCGPAGPLPETYQRYRLVAHLGSGGQAEVYRAVRLCGGVTSAPLTVKVFRVDPHRPLIDELRSWDKGDAALMDLNNRGVSGICRRADGFYGPPPHRPGEPAGQGNAVPYQVYDYFHGVNLREYVNQRAGMADGAKRLNAVAALNTLAGIMQALHNPKEPGATPVLHMDIKPANLMVLTSGEIRLIDFTGARYWRAEEITQIAYTPESGGPEASAGARGMGPAYDVHGFGAVAYFLVTGTYPRVEGDGQKPTTPERAVLRRHPNLERQPALRDHLHAPLADRPGDRPTTSQLPEWIEQLGQLVLRGSVAEVGVDWTEPATVEQAADRSRAVGRAQPRPPLTGTETEAFGRIERLERELVELRAHRYPPSAMAPDPTRLAGRLDQTRLAAPGSVGSVSGGPAGSRPAHHGSAAVASAPVSPAVGLAGQPGNGDGGQMRGRAKVPQRRSVTEAEPAMPEPAVEPPVRRPPVPGALRRGSRFTVLGGCVAFLGWAVWALSSGGNLSTPFTAFVLVLLVAAGLFALTRLIGRLVIEQRLGRARRGASGAHAVTGLFLCAAGVAYFAQTSWVVSAVSWIRGFLS